MIQEHGRRELVGRGRRSGMPNERSDVGRCGEMHDAEQNEEHPTSLKQPNTSRCRHDQTRMTKRITSGLTRKSCSCGSFEPDLDFVAIRIGHVSVREARSELATTEQSPSGAFHLGDGTVDVVGVHEPKAEMCDAPTETGGGVVLDKGDDVVPTGSLGMDESISTPVLLQTEDPFVEPQRTSQVADGEINVRKAVGLNHCYVDINSSP